MSIDIEDIDVKTNPVTLTALLMQKAEATHLNGPQKKQIVMNAFGSIAPHDDIFKNDILPYLIDTLKFVARGGYHLAKKTKCCGLF